ncbi:DUF2683 family protein [Candidatus Woesearchaeota archaeon]|nr:DUF2683 family protein [Candidatus Woesearchaeota archaeon]
MIQARMEMDDYTARVLDVIKGKFGLKNRSEALKKLALEAGNDYIELAPNEMVLKELDAIYESHKKKHGNRKMNDTELRKLLGL